MIIQVILDMRSFYIILVISVCAFGNSFYILSQSNNDPSQNYITSYVDGISWTYRLMLGDFDTSVFDDNFIVLNWILFYMASMFLIIVMLNLLISIISDSYEKIQKNATNSMYKELASLIYDNYFLANFQTNTKAYIVVARPDTAYIEEVKD
jgi:NADH:ubiquinone oxidoreductase subunit 6 (subunit J)